MTLLTVWNDTDPATPVLETIDEAEIRRVLAHPLVMVCSDGFVMPPVEEIDDPGLYWPCSYGEYPGILERYVRDEPFLRLEEAIRKVEAEAARRPAA